MPTEIAPGVLAYRPLAYHPLCTPLPTAPEGTPEARLRWVLDRVDAGGATLDHLAYFSGLGMDGVRAPLRALLKAGAVATWPGERGYARYCPAERAPAARPRAAAFGEDGE